MDARNGFPSELSSERISYVIRDIRESVLGESLLAQYLRGVTSYEKVGYTQSGIAPKERV